MNIALILSGGVGRRFGNELPKQYNRINGKVVIDYVIEACLSSEKTNKIIVVCDPSYVDQSDILPFRDDIDVVFNGKDRYDSLNNGLLYINEKYKCTNICIFDAVAPMVYPELIDMYFDKLNEYDCVITCQKITGELGNYNFDTLLRENYYITQSPESFKYKLLTDCFNPNFESTELANQLPKDSKRYLNFEFKQNVKITYAFDLEYIGQLLKYFKNNS